MSQLSQLAQLASFSSQSTSTAAAAAAAFSPLDLFANSTLPSATSPLESAMGGGKGYAGLSSSAFNNPFSFQSGGFPLNSLSLSPFAPFSLPSTPNKTPY